MWGYCGKGLVALVVKNPSARSGDIKDMASIPGSRRSLKEGTATHSSILPWRIPWTEEPGEPQCMGSQSQLKWPSTHAHTPYCGKWQWRLFRRSQLPLVSSIQPFGLGAGLLTPAARMAPSQRVAPSSCSTWPFCSESAAAVECGARARSKKKKQNRPGPSVICRIPQGFKSEDPQWLMQKK